MRPYLEKLPYDANSSISVLNRRLNDGIPFQWHHHPEFELTLTLNSRGQRFVGDHVGEYGNGDLVLVGPNQPHTWASSGSINRDVPHIALVIWFHPDWANKVVDSLVEFKPLKAFLQRAGKGLLFSNATAQAIKNEQMQLFDLPPSDRVLALLKILMRLSADLSPEQLSSAPAQQSRAPESRDRIDRVLTHIHANYARKLGMEELANVAALSVSGLHRLFAKHTRSTVSSYLMQLRIGDACARLSGTTQPIAFVASEVGFTSLANFNRQFRSLKSMTPREYRSYFQTRER